MERQYFYRRKLPHYQPDGKTFFITFSTSKHWPIPERARCFVADSIHYGNGRRFDLHAFVVMPDHIHIILTPRWDANGTFSISDIMQAIKGASAHRINHFLGRYGKVWQDESFDRALRCDEAIDRKMSYVIENPVRAGLVQTPGDYPWAWSELDEGTGEDARASISEK